MIYKTIIKGLFFISLLYIFISCSRYTASLQTAFKQAGKNKSELKTVLKYYSKNKVDSLKRKAAVFLIENMDGHFSYQSDHLKDLCLSLDSINKSNLKIMQTKQKYDSVISRYNESDEEIHIREDLKYINAKYLIKNIDQAFETWKSPYAHHLDFNQFCEYLLPYRVGTEELIEWRELYIKEYLPEFCEKLKIKTDSTNLLDACEILRSDYISTSLFSNAPLIDYNPIVLKNLKFGTCKEWSHLAVFLARTIGLPISVDYTPHWATRSMGHNWNALLYNDRSLDFAMREDVKIGEHINSNPLKIAPKVFRNTFAKQKDCIAAMASPNEEIPDEFCTSFYKDVSSEYFEGVDIPVNLTHTTSDSKNQFVYICVFDNRNWKPVFWAKNINQTAFFIGMNTGIAYMPAYYHNSEIKPVAYPVVVSKDGSILQLRPNLAKKQTVFLKRKYTDLKVREYADRMIGGKFQVSNDSSFKEAIDIYEIKEKPEINFQTIQIKPDRPYKFFRYLSPANSYGNIAEIEIYDSNLAKINGHKISSKSMKYNSGQEAVFDGNVLSYANSNKADNSWVGLQFDNPVQISKLVYLPRNDDNFIREGQIYELFYWDNKWISLGQQKGSLKTQKLTYNNVPTNTLLLLSNLSEGTEERIFTYENGKQVWW